MRKYLLLFATLLLATPATAKTLDFDLQNGPGVKLVDVDIEEAGAVYDGGPSGPTFEIGRGEKTFRAIITADILVFEHERQARSSYYSRFQYIARGHSDQGIVYQYRIRDVVRFPIKVINGGTVDFTIHFDPSVPGLTFENEQGQLVPIDRMTRLSDNQEFKISPQPFGGTDSISPRSVCLEQRPNPQNPTIMECSRWGRR